MAAILALTMIAAVFTAQPASATEDSFSCTATITFDEAVVSWSSLPAAETYVIYRTVESRPQAWRGRTSDTSFTDSGWMNYGLVDYAVAPRSAAGAVGAPTPCTRVTPGTPIPACVVLTVPGPGGASFQVAMNTTGAFRYAIYRSVEGSPFYYRGATGPAVNEVEPLPTISYQDLVRSTDTKHLVVPRYADGTLGPVTECESPAAMDPLPACRVGTDGGGVEVVWDRAVRPLPVFGELQLVYVISRSVDGGPMYWRGRTTGTSFDDTPRGVMRYQVQVRSILTGIPISAPVTCT